jgi:hypothetical protein
MERIMISETIRFLYYVNLGTWPKDIKEDLIMYTIGTRNGLCGGRRLYEAKPTFVRDLIADIIRNEIVRQKSLGQYKQW